MAKKNNKLKFGRAFSARDIEKARDQGWNDNKILRAAASAPFVKNSANKALSSFNSLYLDPTAAAKNARGTDSQVGSANLVASYISQRQRDAAGNKDPKRIFSWNGLNADGTANALTINKPDNRNLFGSYRPDDGKGNKYGEWTKPLGKKQPATPAANLGINPSPSTPSGSPSPSSTPSPEALTPEPFQKSSGMSSAGMDTSVDDSVTGFRRKRSRARTLGLTSKGTSQFKIGGQSSKSSGLNLGIL